MDIKTVKPQKIVSLTTRNNIKLLPLTCDYVKSLVKGIGMTEDQVETIAFSTEFVLKRRMLNAYKGIGEITLDILVAIDRIWIEITDKGLPYWVDDSEIQQGISKLPVKMRMCNLKKLGTEGQCFSMCFDIAPNIDITAFKKQNDIEEELLDSNLNIRPTKSTEREITEVIKCIYSNYGYGYLNHKIYDLEQMKAILNDGKQWSYMGVNDHEQIMAHTSLAFHEDFPNMPELGGLVCKPYCRGHNVAGHMVKAVCDQSQEKGINGIFAQPVAFHPISQKIMNKNNFIPTALLLHYITPESAGTYADGDRRLDVFLCAKLFDTEKIRKICVPDAHKDFIAGIYKKMKAECEFIPESEPIDEGEFIMKFDREIHLGQIIVDKVPVNFENDLSGIMKEFSKNSIMLTEAYINMSDNGAVTAYNKLKEQGFIFSGILPGSDKGEYMIMMNLMDIPVEWDKIVAIEGYDEIMSYIKNQ